MLLSALSIFALAQTVENGILSKEEHDTKKAEEFRKVMEKLHRGMTKRELYLIFAGYQERGYEKSGNEEWVAFMNWLTEEPGDLIIIYLKDGRVETWSAERAWKKKVY